MALSKTLTNVEIDADYHTPVAVAVDTLLIRDPMNTRILNYLHDRPMWLFNAVHSTLNSGQIENKFNYLFLKTLDSV